MEPVTFMIGDAGPFDGNARPQGVERHGSVEFGGLDLNDQALFLGKMSVVYRDGTQVSGNIHALSFSEAAGLKTGKIDFSRIVAEIAGKG